MNVNIRVHVPVVSRKDKEITVNAVNSGKRGINKIGKGKAYILTKDKNKVLQTLTLMTV